MKRLYVRAAGLVLLLGNPSVGLAIQKPLDGGQFFDGIGEAAHRVIRPQIVTSQRAVHFDHMMGGQGLTKIDKHSGAVRVMSGYQFGSSMVDAAQGINGFDQAARNVVQRYAKVFGVRSEDLRLEERASLINKSEQFLKYRVSRNGLLVQDATIDFRFKFGKLVQVVSQSFAEAPTDERAVDQSVSLKLAQRGDMKIVAERGQLYRVEQSKRGYQLVRVQEFEVKTRGDRYIAQVEAATGRIFELAPTKFYARGRARAHIHPRLWKDELVDTGLSHLQLTTTAGQVTTSENGSFEVATAQTPALNGFVGSSLKVSPVTGDIAKSTGTLTGNAWDVFFAKEGAAATHEDKAIAQSMIYVHTNKIIDHAKKYISADWLNAQLTANANLASSCNAHWDGSTINLYSAGDYSGMTCVNTGLISDVVYHEWGHGLDDHTGGIEDGAYSEGFGDICSLLMTASPELAPNFTTDGMMVRELVTDKIYPQDRGQVHDEGLIIGSTFYDLFLALEASYGREKSLDMIANYAFKSILTASKYTDVYDALLVIDDNDANLTNGTPNLCTINEAFSAHGLAEKSSACLLGEFTDIEVNDRSGNRNGILEPGEAAEVNIRLYNGTQLTLTDLIGTASLTTPPAGVSLASDRLNWGSVVPDETVLSENGFDIELSDEVACGTSIPFSVKLEANGRTVIEKGQLLAGVLMGEPQLVAATGLPMPIKDKGSITIPLNVSGGAWTAGTKVHRASIKIAATHTYVGDLMISLVSPAGKKVVVYDGEGSGDDVNVDLDLTDALSSEAGKGTWNLVVEDQYEVDTGNVNLVEFNVTPASFRCEQ
jgi:subtilisin-like proprotein convertase family protein